MTGDLREALRAEIDRRVRDRKPWRPKGYCAYCGVKAKSYACPGHSDLPRLDPLEGVR